ncbi:sulfurtransferase [Sphingomonas piscis]|uniref:Sulfurtransferase n=1 Tax=Sphingomonas piscis TaxID=2714943 RepID=A0A6G7YQY9_9SPHN|nr:sulfurtransferase [Sphingomonas piscis]QIK79153.1 sulfurtransferase [Sphingomonas piscis]
MDSLVSTGWLADQLGAGDLSIVDCTFFLPELGRDAEAEFLAAHIPGAVRMDITEVADRSNPAPHMLPSADQFAAAIERIGVSSSDRIVVYDNSPHRTAARGWFTFRHFGAAQVAILDGGFQKWAAEGRAVESGEPKPRPARFEATERRDVAAKAELPGSGTIVDARSAERFEGRSPEPRPGLAPGHIPGSRSLPMASLYNADGTMKGPDELQALFAVAGVDPMEPFTSTCGSGVTANSLIFAAHLLGNDSAKLYDGSWSEWGADPDTPKAVGPA